MKSSLPLVVSALGPFELTLDGQAAPKFKYLDSRELLVYLLDRTSVDALGLLRGKTKEEIGAALWGYATDAQLNAKLKARLNDVRKVLGAKGWILFEEENYKFDWTREVRFDVREFGYSVSSAERFRQSGNSNAEREALQRAVTLYRGDFLQDYTARRTRRDSWNAEREWFLVLREALQNDYRRALERLAQLEWDAAHLGPAIELLRKLVVADEYDDTAHHRLMLALALQGKRSQALRHYQTLVKHRDIPPAEELTALFEKIKRNEDLGTEQGNIGVGVGSSPVGTSFVNNLGASAAATLPPPFQVPADVPRFVGRQAQFAELQTRLTTSLSNSFAPVSTSRSLANLQFPITRLCLVGMGGIGKTSLAVHAAYRLREQFPDGVLWGNLRDSTPLAVLSSWERAFGCDFSGLPDLNSRAASLRSLLHEKKTLVILDDVWDAADARALVLNGAQQRTIFTSRSADIAAALDAQVIEMPALEADESADLLTRIVGSSRVAAEPQYAQEICRVLGQLPLAIDITAHRLTSRPRWTLREMAEKLRTQMQRLDELQLADRAVRATFALSWEVLSSPQRHALAYVGVFDARSFTAAALAFVAELKESTASELLDSLVALSLLSLESSTRYRQHPLLADFSREKLENRSNQDAESKDKPTALPTAQSRLANYYLQFATEQRKNYLALEDEWDNLNVGIEIAHAQEMWQHIIDYGDVLTDAWFARGRFTDARRNYGFVMRGARELEEQDPYIAAALNWGKACIDQGDYAEAEEHIQHGLQTSREVSDQYGIANALFLLGRVSVERSEYERAQTYLEESQDIRERFEDRAGVAETLYMQARIKYFFEDYNEAERLITRALEVHKSLKVNHSNLVLLRTAAGIFSKLRKHDLARQYLEDALAVAEQCNNKSEYAAILYSMSTLLWQMSLPVLAKEFAEKAMLSLKYIGDRKGVQFAHEQLSLIAVDLNQAESALQFGDESLKSARQLQDRSSMVRLLSRIGDLHLKNHQKELAYREWREALLLAEQIQHPLRQSLRERLGVLSK